jgi:hypothetical protein
MRAQRDKFLPLQISDACDVGVGVAQKRQRVVMPALPCPHFRFQILDDIRLETFESVFVF